MIFRTKSSINRLLRDASLALGFLVICHQAEAAQYYHGMLVLASRACLHKDAQAKKALAEAARKGDYDAVQAYAAYWVCKSQPRKATPWLKRSSDMGDGWSSQMLAQYLLSSGKPDSAALIQYLNRAALHGNAWAARELSFFYLDGMHGIERNPHKASYWALYAENVKEIVPNTFFLAASYRNGWGVPHDLEKAKQLYNETMTIMKRAAGNGDPYADMLFYRFYTHYCLDFGLKKDMVKAAYWLHQAAAKGYPPAIAILHGQEERKSHA
jgi:FOG: TPR repeat, SEL1 subfamily